MGNNTVEQSIRDVGKNRTEDADYSWHKDIVVQPVNALILAERLPDAQLVVYPDSSHGAQYQHASLFLKQANLFFNV
jgi:pimeloyl-ACP methyl ester carboxylesterase